MSDRMNRLIRAADQIDLGVPQPALVTVPNVQLLEVGEEWETSTGVFTFNTEDLASCITSQEDPSLRTPVLKLGHVDPRFDGQPSFGRIINMRLENNNQTLVGDFAAMPLWLAQVMYTAYPRRSIEGQMQYTTRTGNTWPMILTGVALLGDAYPAIDTLEDIQALWGATPPPLFPAGEVDEIFASGSFFKARKVTDMPDWLKKKEVVKASSPVKASVSLDTVRRTYYDSLGAGQMWWWIREVQINPLMLIVDDDEGGLFQVPVTVGADDSITFGDPSPVKIEYVAASGEPVVAKTAGQVVAATYTSAEETGRTSRPDPEEAATVASTNTTNQQETLLMLTDEALEKLGLKPGATSEEISAAIVAQGVVGDPEPPQTEQTAPTTEAPAIPEGMVLVDAATLAEMRNGIAAATGLVERQAKADRDAILDGAIRAGKFPLGRRAHYEALLSADPEGGKALISSLEPGLVPVAETGEQGGSVAAAADQTAYPAGWGRSIAAGRRSGERVKVVQD